VRAAAIFAVALLGAIPAQAATIATATNFAATAEAIADAYVASGGERPRFSFASTGVLFAQIRAGAPFDAFLAADVDRPMRAEAAGYAVPGSRFVYARGRLALLSAEGFALGLEQLRGGRFEKLALADARTAPYGLAAEAVLATLGWPASRLRDEPRRFVRGKNIGQTYQFVAARAVDAGFVALAQIRGGAPVRGRAVVVPGDLHPPIDQAAVLLAEGPDPDGAAAFLAFLRDDPAAAAALNAAGYERPR